MKYGQSMGSDAIALKFSKELGRIYKKFCDA